MRRIVLSEIALRNFRSYDGANLILPENPGITFLFGVNGSGKSTWIDALVYTLYGSSVEGIKGSDLVRQSAPRQALETEVVIRDSGERKELTRNWTTGKLTVIPDDMDRLVVLGRDQFMASVVFGQGLPLFIDLDPARRLEVFEELLGLDVYIKASLRAANYAAWADVKLRDCEAQVAQLDGKLSVLPTFEELDAQVAKLEAANEIQGQQAVERLTELDAQIAELTVRVSKERKSLSLVELALDQPSDLDSLAEACRIEISKQNRDLILVQSSLERERTALRSVNIAGVCITCGQPLPPQVIEMRKAELAREIDALEIRQKSLEASIDEYRKALNEAAEEIRARDKRRDSQLSSKGEIQGEIRALNSQIESLTDNRKEIEGLLQQLETALTDAKEKLAQSVTEREQVLEQKQEADAEAGALRSKKLQGQTLQGAFKDMRLRVVARVLDFLTVESNALLSQLGLGDAKFVFSSYVTAKSGNQKPSLSVSVERNGKSLPYKAYSPGERQRLRIASAMGLSSVIQSIANIEFGFEVWDEPSSWLSPDGVVTLLQVLQDRSVRYNKRIILIDHRMLDFTGFDQLIEIEKGTDGISRISQQRVFSGE